MKSILVFALVVTLGTVLLLTSCTTVPRDNTVQSNSVSTNTSTYSK